MKRDYERYIIIFYWRRPRKWRLLAIIKSPTGNMNMRDREPDREDVKAVLVYRFRRKHRYFRYGSLNGYRLRKRTRLDG